jgi:SAM-dependent methyltransferase
MSEKYIVDISEGGSSGLGKLDYLYNPTTQEFLLNSGLKVGMNALDIGCGSGVMTCWMASQVGNDGMVIGIENDINQLHAAKKRAEDSGIKNVRFELCSAYDIESLGNQFDFVYCRFVLHHLHETTKVIDKIYQVLKSGGIYAAEEGIVNYAFSYPFTSAWGNEENRLPPVWTDVPVGNRDPNIGVKLVTKMKRTGFKVSNANIIHPVLITREEKRLLLLGMDEMKNFYLSEGHTENDWIELIKHTEAIVDNDEQIAGFYGSCQVAGIK